MRTTGPEEQHQSLPDVEEAANPRTATASSSRARARPQSCHDETNPITAPEAEAGEALLASEARSRALITSIAEYVLELDGEGICLNVWADDDGLIFRPPAEILGRRLADVLPAKVGPLLLRALARVRECGRAEEVEFPLDRPEGRCWREARINTIEAAPGAPATFSVFLRDITARKDAELALMASEDRFRELLHNSPNLVFFKDAEGRYLAVSRAFERAFGISQEQAVGRTDDELFSAEQAAAFRAHDQEVIQTGGVVEFEEVAQYADGPHTSIVQKFPLRDEHGNVYATAGVVTDVTERSRAAAKLQASEERFRLLVDGVLDHAIYGLDAEGRISSWNVGAQRLYGYRAAEVVGKHISIFFTDADLEARTPERELQVAARAVHFEVDAWRVRKGGSRFWAHVEVTGLFDAQGDLRGFSKLTRDLTEWKKADDAVRDLSARILRLQDDERRRIARELHDSTAQTIAALGMNLALIGQLRGVTANARASRALAESQALATLAANEIRDLSHLLHPPDLDEVGLTAAVRWYASKLRERTDIDVQVEIDLPRETRRLPRDAEVALFRVVQESLTNVQRHSGSPEAKVRIVEHPDRMEVEVKDHGRSIPRALVETKGHGVEMLGVGLGGMRERMRQLDGRLDILEGRPGTIVRASVPIRPRPSEEGRHEV